MLFVFQYFDQDVTGTIPGHWGEEKKKEYQEVRAEKEEKMNQLSRKAVFQG